MIRLIPKKAGDLLVPVTMTMLLLLVLFPVVFTNYFEEVPRGSDDPVLPDVMGAIEDPCLRDAIIAKHDFTSRPLSEHELNWYTEQCNRNALLLQQRNVLQALVNTSAIEESL